MNQPTGLKSWILNFIRTNHRGKTRSITIDQLIVQFCEITTDGRVIDRLIRDLTAEGYPILKQLQKPYGYYYALDRAEIDEYCAELMSRMRYDFTKIASLDKELLREFLGKELEALQ